MSEDSTRQFNDAFIAAFVEEEISPGFEGATVGFQANPPPLGTIHDGVFNGSAIWSKHHRPSVARALPLRNPAIGDTFNCLECGLNHVLRGHKAERAYMGPRLKGPPCFSRPFR